MHTTSKIKRHISSLAADALFTTRELLIHGSRSAVDNALSRMVSSEMIYRVARGVFIRSYCAIPRLSAEKIAKTKAGAFAKEIASIENFCSEGGSQSIAAQDNGSLEHRFCTTGSTTRFQSIVGTIVFQKANARKLKLLDLPAGVLMRSLWILGDDHGGNHPAMEKFRKLEREQQEHLRNLIGLMPTWLAQKFPFYADDRWFGIPRTICNSMQKSKLREVLEEEPDSHEGLKSKWMKIKRKYSKAKQVIDTRVEKVPHNPIIKVDELMKSKKVKRTSGSSAHAVLLGHHHVYLETRACALHSLDCDRHLRV